MTAATADKLLLFAPRKAPGATVSWLLAVGVHVLLAVVLFFGIRWRTQQPAPVMAELWTPVPVAEAPRVAPPPPPPPVEAKPEPKPEPRPEPKPEPRVEPKPPPKPDIALEQEKKRKDELEKKRLEEERLRAEREKAEREKAEKLKAERERAEKLKAEEERKQREQAALEKRRFEEENRRRMQDQLAAELKGSAAAAKPGPQVAASGPVTGPATAGDPSARAGYIDKIRAKIRGNLVLPLDIQGNPEAEFDVVQLPTGEIASVRLRKSSGVKAYDDAVERAILKSSPLPLPEKRELFERELRLKFRPRE